MASKQNMQGNGHQIQKSTGVFFGHGRICEQCIRKEAAAAAKAKVVRPAMNDGVGARTMENGLRYGERKLTNH